MTAATVLALVSRIFPAGIVAEAVEYDEAGLPPGVSPPAAVGGSVPKRQAEFVAGRLCARAALGRAGWPGQEEIAVGAMRAPVWPPGFVGSISHTRGVAAAVAAPTSKARALGLDVEPIVRSDLAASLRTLVAHPQDLALIGPHVESAEATFTVVFAAKEALFKCLAPLVGKYFDFADAEVAAATRENVALRLRRNLAPDFAAGTEIVVRYATTGAIAVAGASLPSLPPSDSAP